MTSDNTRRNPGTPLRKIIAYSTGEGATSLTMNGIAAFAMLYYVQVLGLNSKWAGLALSVSMLGTPSPTRSWGISPITPAAVSAGVGFAAAAYRLGGASGNPGAG